MSRRPPTPARSMLAVPPQTQASETIPPAWLGRVFDITAYFNILRVIARVHLLDVDQNGNPGLVNVHPCQAVTGPIPVVEAATRVRPLDLLPALLSAEMVQQTYRSNEMRKTVHSPLESPGPIGPPRNLANSLMASLQWLGLRSQPIHRRPSVSAAKRVLPSPQQQSRTTSPGFVSAPSTTSSSSMGLVHGCGR